MRCKSRRCVECGQLWAGDTRKRLVVNLDLGYDGPVLMATVTAPGRDLLRHDPDGRVSPGAAWWWNKNAPRHWRRLHHRAAQETRRSVGRRPTVLAWVWQYQARGVLHKHVVLGIGTPVERAAAHAYVNHLHRLAGDEDFGYVDRGRWDPKRRRRSLREMSGKHAGRYVAKYLVQRRDDGGYAVSDTVMHEDVPPLIVYVARTCTERTGCTARALREHRYLVATGEELPLRLVTQIVAPEYRALVEAVIAARGP
jgi:hypothetical protein